MSPEHSDPKGGRPRSREPVHDGDPLVGVAVGPYRIERVIGEGGIGIVYEAVQERPIRRRVALKLIRFGMDTREVVRRFEMERQSLARMSHPAIASVFDAGATAGGRPYFVMERVEGEPITQYCDRKRLDVEQRLGLFLQVCAGIHHAHQKGIIHRDIKPSNVLVMDAGGDPSPKIIDFGVAKAIGSAGDGRTGSTAAGTWIGTPEYMSPEQAGAAGSDVDTRSDVYSLGILMYELLSGAHPFGRGGRRGAPPDELRRRIREEEPARPSAGLASLDATAVRRAAGARSSGTASLRRRLSGELDWIVLKAIEKDRARRYGSVAELALDIERHLAREPVLAGPPTAAYRVRRFVSRHRAGVAVTALAVTGSMVFAAIMVVQAGRIARERDRANLEAARAGREAETARLVSEFLLRLFEQSDPDGSRGDALTAREIMDEGARRLEVELGDEPEIRARLMTTIGRVYGRLGLSGEAASILEDSVEILRRVHGEGHAEVARTLGLLASVHQIEGDLDEARRIYKQALAMESLGLKNDPERLAAILMDYATLLDQTGESALALKLNTRAQGIFEAAGLHDAVAYCLRNIAYNLYNLGDSARAVPAFERALELRERVSGPDHPEVAILLNGLATLRWGEEGPASALPHLERSLAILERAYPPDHPLTLSTRDNLNQLHAYIDGANAGRPDPVE